MQKGLNILRIIYAILLYATYIVFGVGLFGAYNNSSSTELLNTIFIVTLVFIGISILLGLVIIVLSIATQATSNDPKSLRQPLIIKFVLIPYYFINFIFWAIIGIGSLNPFLMLFGGFAIVLAVLATYFSVIVTSIGNVIYFIRNARKNPLNIPCAISQFFFCFDVLGAAIGYALNREKKIIE